MKHRLTYLAAILVIFCSVGIGIFHPLIAEAANNCNQLDPNCIIAPPGTGGSSDVAKVCPSSMSGFPSKSGNFAAFPSVTSSFFQCETTWAKGTSSYAPNTYLASADPGNTGVVDYCHRNFTGNWLSQCTKGFSKNGQGSASAVCKSNESACLVGFAAGGDANQNPNAPANQNNGAGGPASTTCDSGSFSFNWALCPIFDGVQGVTQWIFNNLIKPLLMTNPVCLDSSGNACDNTIYKVWSGFRIYGDIFLVIVLLVIVFGESIGGGMIDAYTAKKILPRLLAAAVLINLSVYIMAFAIDVTNVVGGGLGQLLTAPLGANGFYKIQPDGIQQAEIFGGVATAGLLAGAFVISTTGIVLLLLGLAITGAIAVVGVFITLIIRQAIIVALLLVSPIAFALWCLPNTQQWFKRWWDTFFQMMLVYPMIIMAFAVADILGSITANNKGSGSSALNDIVAFMLLVIPLYMIPFMLRSSNRILGAVQGAVSNVGRQVNAVSGRRVLGAAGAEAGKTFSLARSGDRFRKAEQGSFKERLNRGISGATNIDSLGRSGLGPKAIKRDIAAAVQANKNTARRELAEKSAAFQTFAGNDDMLEAAGLLYTEGEGSARRHLASKGMEVQQQEQAIAQLRSAQKDMGAQNLALTSAVANAGTGTGYSNGPGEAYDAVVKASGGDMALAGSAYADMRGGFEKARRFDALESFSGAMGHMEEIKSSSAADRADVIKRVNDEAADGALEVQGIGAVLGGRGQSARNFGPALQRRLQKAQQAVIEARGPSGRATIQQYDPDSRKMQSVTISADEAQRQWIQAMASTSAAIDSAGSAAPEVQRLLADTIHNNEVDVSTLPRELQQILTRNTDGTFSRPGKMTISTVMDKLEGTEAFGQMKKVYSQRYQQDAAQRAAGGGNPPGGAPPGGIPPVVPPL